MTKKLVLASGNQHKLLEMNSSLYDLGFEVFPQSRWVAEEADENGYSFVENALIKARHAAAASGLPALADDSGLEVDALDGAPGIISARYAGEPSDDTRNTDKLLAQLNGVATDQRSARFVCVIVYMRHATDATPLICEGYWRGFIATAPHGSGGFGYDPVFFLPEEGITVAEMSAEKKNRLSHRAKALRVLAERLGQ